MWGRGWVGLGVLSGNYDISSTILFQSGPNIWFDKMYIKNKLISLGRKEPDGGPIPKRKEKGQGEKKNEKMDGERRK